MSTQVGSGRLGDWERKQTQQYSQQQGGYLDTPYLNDKKKKQSVMKQQPTKTAVVKVWHEGAD